MTITLNGTTGVAGVDGSASSPAIQGNDTNTGIFFPAADTIAFAEGGAEVARFDSNGNLGIGTSSPANAYATFGNSNLGGANRWAAYFGTNSANSSAAPSFGLTIGWNKSAGQGESNIIYGVGAGATPALSFASSDGVTLTESMRLTSAGLLQFNSGFGSVATAYACRAWVNFNGTGTVAIRASGNVSSITDNGTGYYTVNLTNSMPDINYAVNVTATDDNAAATFAYEAGTFGGFRTASSFRLYTYGTAPRDAQGVYATLFR